MQLKRKEKGQPDDENDEHILKAHESMKRYPKSCCITFLRRQIWAGLGRKAVFHDSDDPRSNAPDKNIIEPTKQMIKPI
jgi:hypothetical protein